MDRDLVAKLVKRGVIEYPKGKHRIWVSRCFVITVRPNRIVDISEYEDYTEEKNGSGPKRESNGQAKELKDMVHVGRSVVSLEDGSVTEHRGFGRRCLA